VSSSFRGHPKRSSFPSVSRPEPSPRRGGRGGLVTGHVRSPPVSRQNELVHPTLYKPSSAGINHENKSRFGVGNRVELADRDAQANHAHSVRARPASRIVKRPVGDPPSLCQQTSDKRKTLIALLSLQPFSTPPCGWRDEGWNNACTQADLVEYARQIAAVKGLQPEQGLGHEHACGSRRAAARTQVITWE